MLSATYKKREVILIDDNPIDLQVCKMVFTKTQPDIEFKIFENGFTAMHWMNENEHTLVKEENNILLLDLNMPVMDGWGFLNYFEKLVSEIKNRTSIYILTSTIDPADIKRAEQFPSVKQFFTKPLSNKMIRSILETDKN